MNSFSVQFHQEDQIDSMTVQKLSENDFNQLTESGTRHLFELDTNISFFVFFDAFDEAEAQSHLILQYEEDSEDPSACYGFQKEDFYEFMALYLNDLEFQDEEDSEEEEQDIWSDSSFSSFVISYCRRGKDIEA